MASSRQQPHRRAMSISKPILSPIIEDKDKILPNQPPTPKVKPFDPTKPKKCFDSILHLELKNILSTLIFFCALIFFLGSLSGIGPPFDDLDYAIKKEPNVHQEIDIVGSNAIIDDDDDYIVDKSGVNENPEVWDEPYAEILLDDDDENSNLAVQDNYGDVEETKNVVHQESNELATDKPLADKVINDIKPEAVAPITEETNQPKQEESILEDIKIVPNPITDDVDENNTNFGHSDEILVNNSESNDVTSNNNVPKNLVTVDKLNATGLPNKLNKNKLRNYKSGGSGSSDGTVDYAMYTYQVPNPHFTYDDVLVSLTEEERNEISTTQLTEMNTDESLDSSCGTWQKDYAKLNEDILAGKEDQRYVAYICEASSNCGGLADRILGMTSTFLFALLTNRAYLADWQTPLPLDKIFDSPNIDWSFDSLSPESVIKDLKTIEISVIDFDTQHLDNHFLLSNWTTKYPDPFIKFYTNRGMIIRTFDSKYYAQPLKDIGLRPHTAFGCIFDYLFRPTPPAMSFITKYTSLFSIHNIYSVGIQIRAREDTNALQDYEYFFRCADQLTRTYAAPDQKVIYFLITDSVALRDEAVQKLEHVIISGLPIKSHHGHHDNIDDVNNAIIENWILSKTDYRVISPGGYGKLSAFHSKQLHTTVLMNYPDAFITFSKLANEWSLG
ncbi:6013_t:CDS:2 [Funneliformis geosporum]|uniref:16205_t:CDS:1 n=1 Tax=Funneliformis geosporum TaxID=1117311 RepID=A0A9W4SBQ9_9GLOM|nr:16205_t:CDS:2 [Funneliformis geosporum]CAI2174210.1 6013_t:CDS:2 [Funneliformis geosporum]